MEKWIFFCATLMTLWGSDQPLQWGENVTGVITRFKPQGKQVALTLDACGGSVRSSQFDEKLIGYLQDHHIPATLFINARWIDSNPILFNRLASNPIFEIANHGTANRPLSVNGRSVYGINGTVSKDDVIKEVRENNLKIEQLTTKKPKFFRSGTAYYDEIAVALARQEGVEIAGFSIIADAGATLPSDEVFRRIASAKSGDIIIAHMNHPESGTAQGVIEGVEALQSQGFHFVRLSDIQKRLEHIP